MQHDGRKHEASVSKRKFWWVHPKIQRSSKRNANGHESLLSKLGPEPIETNVQQDHESFQADRSCG